MVFKKGQAALDFLMTYGWAIALVVIIAAVLFAMGLFDTSNFVGNKAAGFAGIGVSAWRVSSTGTMQLMMQNQVGRRINVTSVSATVGGITAATSTFATNPVPTGSQTNASITGFSAANVGTGYTSNVTIAYTDTESGFAYVTTGTLTGKVA